eukprot:6191139-Pleurochrysis_carterae.AAC.1
MAFPDSGLKSGTRGNASSAASTGGARDQRETRGQGGAGAQSLEPHSIYPVGNLHAAQWSGLN